MKRIGTITLAFTVGHSLTLALGTLGLPVPQQPIEALIAVSILIAAAHAIRPIFPGREPLMAGVFGLIHGLAFSTTLSVLNLSGWQLAVSLLGFNFGIEMMQLVVVLVVLPPMIALARTTRYKNIRGTDVAIVAAAATGWLIDRIGFPNFLGTAADSLGAASPWLVAILWLAAILVVLRASSSRRSQTAPAVGFRTEIIGPVTSGVPAKKIRQGHPTAETVDLQPITVSLCRATSGPPLESP